ncbi:MAG TPA: hypothetical protein VFA79_22485 [Myxococcales bacterium]|nr:hypothetical protein [Myxococcales bacterium]
MQRVPHRSVRSLAAGAARGVVLAVAAAWVLWLVAAQALLWTPLLRNLLNSRSRVHLQYASAWSVWPGTVHARGLVLTGQDRAVEWRLALDEVKATIAIGQLASRLFHATQVHARGIEFALRRRAFLRADVPADVRGLPWIDGYGPIPFKEEGPDDELPDWRYNLFSVWLEDIEGSDVRQIWIDRWRLEGAAEVAGAFYLKPVREVLVAPGVLRLHGANVTAKEMRVAGGVQGSLRVSLGAFDPRQLTMERFFRTVDVDADLRGDLAGIGFLGGQGGQGAAELRAKVRRGRMEQATVSANLGPAAFQGVTATSAAVHASVADGARARVDVGAPSVRSASVRAARLRVDLSGEAPDFAALNAAAVAAVDVSGGRIEDARILGRRLLRSGRVRAGRGSFAAHLEGPLHRLRGTAHVSLRRLAVAARGVNVRGDSRVDARIADLDPWRGADLSGTRITVDQGRLVPDQEIGPGWWARAVLPSARVRFDPLRVDADLEARCRDARPIVGVYAHLKDLPGFLNSLFGMDGLSVRGSAHAGADWLFLPDVTAEGADGASVRATLRENAHSQRGAALLTVHGIPVALDLNGGRSSVHLLGPGDFFADRQREVREKPLARRAPARRR